MRLLRNNMIVHRVGLVTLDNLKGGSTRGMLNESIVDSIRQSNEGEEILYLSNN